MFFTPETVVLALVFQFFRKCIHRLRSQFNVIRSDISIYTFTIVDFNLHKMCKLKSDGKRKSGTDLDLVIEVCEGKL